MNYNSCNNPPGIVSYYYIYYIRITRKAVYTGVGGGGREKGYHVEADSLDPRLLITINDNKRVREKEREPK